MMRRAYPTLLLAAATPAIVSADAPARGESAPPLTRGRDVLLAQLRIRERIVIRIPRVPPARPRAGYADPRERTDWRERKGPRCIAAATLAGAAINEDGDVDLIVTDGRRWRAKLAEDCPTLNFYRGFYLKRDADGMLCAKRDALRSRSGARCEIDRFRLLVAKR